MHSALLIDEIIQLVFEVLLGDTKSSLCRAARCCKAWKDPALDRIWRRLPSAIPLLSLLPGFSMERDGIGFDPTVPDAAFTAFRSYAARVKHIVHCHRVFTDVESISLHLSQQLSNLESARVESRGATGEVSLRMCLAPRLRALALQTGYSKANSATTTVHDMMSLLEGCPSLERLSVRGYSDGCLHIPLSSITALRCLSLHLSSLTMQSFMTVSTFPRLADFDVHADHLSCDDLSTALASTCDSDAPFFPALEKLKIRAQPALVALVLQQLPCDKLHLLHLDATGPGAASVFQGLFSTVATFPLREFTLEHAISVGDSEDIPAYTPDKFFTLDDLRPLSVLSLGSFVLDTSLPLDLSDLAIEELAKWWPHLVRLELGARSAVENAEMNWKPRTSLASLFALAKGCKRLERLVITLDVEARSLLDLGVVPIGCHPLALLSISSRSRPDVASLSALLYRLFPSLVDVTPGFVGEHEDAWDAVQTRVSNLVSRGEDIDLTP